MVELMRLRVPNGWSVLINNFYDTEPVTDKVSGLIENRHEGFTEDVLWIQEHRFHQTFFFPENKYFRIDLGWYPDGAADGLYKAILSWVDDGIVLKVETLEDKNRHVVRDKIEFWLNNIASLSPELNS